LTSGWFRNQPVTYYNFSNPIPSPDGGASVTPAPIYVLFYGDGTPVPDQRNIIDVVPGDNGYSDLWQVHAVNVPDDTVANDIRSYVQIVDGGYQVTPMNVFVNCPVVPEDSELTGGGIDLVAGWYRGQGVYYFDFGLNPTDTEPIYAFFYGDGSPVAGQDNIVDTEPGEPDYSAFWQVHTVTVPDDYVPNSIRSEADLLAAGHPIQVTDMLVNCPIVTFPPTDVSLSGFGGEGSNNEGDAWPLSWLLLVTAGMGLLAGFIFLWRHQRINVTGR
jgi:hypothetical protein